MPSMSRWLVAGATLAGVPALAAQPIRIDTMGAGTISAPGQQNYQGTFSADGSTFYFFRKHGAGEDYRPWVSVRRGDRWTMPYRLDLGGDHSDLYPAIAPDNRRLVFSSYRPLPGRPAAKPQAHLWITERAGNGWAPARPLTDLITPGHYHSGVRFDPDGTLRWVDQTPDYRTRTFYQAAPVGDGFGARVVAPGGDDWAERLPDGQRLWGPVYNPAGDLVLLGVSELDASGRPRPSDLWVAAREAGHWTMPKRLPEVVNSAGWENFPVFSPNGTRWYFNRDFGAFFEGDTAALRAFAHSPANTASVRGGPPR